MTMSDKLEKRNKFLEEIRKDPNEKKKKERRKKFIQEKNKFRSTG